MNQEQDEAFTQCDIEGCEDIAWKFTLGSAAVSLCDTRWLEMRPDGDDDIEWGASSGHPDWASREPETSFFAERLRLGVARDEFRFSRDTHHVPRDAVLIVTGFNGEGYYFALEPSEKARLELAAGLPLNESSARFLEMIGHQDLAAFMDWLLDQGQIETPKQIVAVVQTPWSFWAEWNGFTRELRRKEGL